MMLAEEFRDVELDRERASEIVAIVEPDGHHKPTSVRLDEPR